MQVEHLNILVLDDDLPQAMPCSVQNNCMVETDKRDHAALFRCQLGTTGIAKHVIDTGDAPPVKLPPCPIPFHFTEQVQNQLKDTMKEGIIRPNKSPWVLQLSMSQRAMEK